MKSEKPINHNSKLTRSVLAIITLLILALTINTIPLFAENEPLMKFAAMSDIHIDDILIQGSHSNRDQFRAALKASYEKGYTDLFLCAGDVSSYGNTKEWEKTRTYITDAGYENIIWALGNHAYGTLGTNTNAGSDFKKFASLDNVYHHDVINGYDFICFGCERTDLLIGDMVYSEAQENWIMGEIEKTAQASPGKPIFVVSHYPIGRTRIEERLSKYQNIIFFYGHEHDDSWEDYTIDKYINTSRSFPVVRVGSVQYGNSNAADSMLVDVYSDKVVLTLDRTDGKTISNNSVTIPLTLPQWKLLPKEGGLYWYVPKRDDVYLCAAYYDDNGRFISSDIIEVGKNEGSEELSFTAVKPSGHTKFYFINSDFIPYADIAVFDQQLHIM